MEVRRIFVPLLALAVCCVVCQSQSTYRFSENNYKGYEGSQRARVTIERDGDTSQSGSVHLTTFASTASAGGDYTSVNIEVEFTPGDPRQNVDIDIIDDYDDDEGETFTVRLSDPVRGDVGSPSQAVVTIEEGDPPTTGLQEEVFIAIIVACVAAVLILLVCCLLIYCLRCRGGDVREDVAYMRKPQPQREHHFTPEFMGYPEPRPLTPPLRRYSPPLDGPSRPRTPSPVHFTGGNPNTQVMVINEPSPPIIEPPPPKPTQVIVIRPQTPEIIRRRPEAMGQTEVIVQRPHRRSRSVSPMRRDSRRIIEEPDDPPFFDDRPIRRVIRKPVPVYVGGDRFGGRGGDRFSDFGGYGRSRFGDFDDDRFGARDALLNLPPGLGSHGPFTSPAYFGRGLPGGFGAQLPSASFGRPALGPPGFESSALPSPGLGYGSRLPAFEPPPPAFGPQLPGFY